jgi:hypothetical protein
MFFPSCTIFNNFFFFFFLRSSIRYLWLTLIKTNLIVDHKNKNKIKIKKEEEEEEVKFIQKL